MQQVKAQNVSGCRPGYEIEQSLMFNASDHSYLTRTAGHSIFGGREWTMSFWVKNPAPSTLGAGGAVIYNMGGQASYPGGAISGSAIRFYNDGSLSVGHDNKSDNLFDVRPGFNGETIKFTDPNAWYHICIVFNSNGATLDDQIKFYVNGKLTSNVSSYPIAKSQQTWFLTSGGNNIERVGNSSENSWNYSLDGYIAEFWALEGAQKGPEHFGIVDSCGVWSPIPYQDDALGYGPRSFYLPFKPNNFISDESGNNNNFSAIAITAESVYADSPTNNFPYFNILWSSRGTDRAWLPRDYYKGNMQCFVTGNSYFNQPMNWALPQEGSWYWETLKSRPIADDPSYWQVGVFDANQCTSNHLPTVTSPHIVAYFNSGLLHITSSYGSPSSTSWSSPIGRWVGVMVDVDNQEFSIWDSSGKVLGYSTAGYVGEMFPVIGRGGNNAGNNVDQNEVNFGQRTFDLVQPPESEMLCSKNLPDPLVKPKENFKAVTYTGSNSAHEVVCGFPPSLVWIKGRDDVSGTIQHNTVFDKIRGPNKALFTDVSDPELNSNFYSLDGFTDKGFDFLANYAPGVDNEGSRYVSWNFKGGDIGANNDGSIPTGLTVNKDMGFSAFTYTGNGVSGATVGHGLGVAPSMVILKKQRSYGSDGDRGWVVWSDKLSTVQNFLSLNSTLAEYAGDHFKNTYPSSSVITLRGSSDGSYEEVNYSGDNYIAYCFANSDIMRVGSYQGNGSVDGPFVALPFKPAFVLIKAIDGAKHWNIYDNGREEFNPRSKVLYPNLTEKEYTWTQGDIDLLSNGFRLITGANDEINESLRYLYLAIAEEPFKIARGN